MWPLLIFALILAALFGVGHGVVGAVIGFTAGALIYLAIGAIVTIGRRRD
jgi:zinc transporter ZupT